MTVPRFETIAEVPVPTATPARVYEHGWQSWSPAGLYPIDRPSSPRPQREIWQTMAFRPDRPAPTGSFQGEGLLAVSPEGAAGPTRIWIAADPSRSVASIRAWSIDGRLMVEADGPVLELPEATSVGHALAVAGDHLSTTMGARPIRALGPGWCSWYGYRQEVTDAVVEENVAIIDREGLDVRVVQIDDGHQAAIGDWLLPSGRIPDLAGLAARIRDGGREAGLWTAPFMVAADSRLAIDHPDWLVGEAVAAADHWGRRIHVLDVTHPDAAAHLLATFRMLHAWGFTFHKIDFLYAGAMVGRRHGDADPIAAYREGLRIIRDAVGEAATILGCGAPLLPSVGLVDAMRVSPDTDHRIEPVDGDLSQPSLRAALAAGRARAWMHGRLWVNDPDCIIASPLSEDRETWSDHLAAYRGLAMSGDRLAGLDGRGMELTRALLRPSGPGPIAWRPEDGPDSGRIQPVREVAR